MKVKLQNFPGSTVDKNLPVNGRDTGLISGVGRCHMPWSNGPRATTTEPMCCNYRSPKTREPTLHNKRSLQHKKPAHHNQRKVCAATKTQSSQKKSEITIVSDDKSTLKNK